GIHTLTAVARDNQGAATISAAVTIMVTTPNNPPVVSISSPTNGAHFAAPANVTIDAMASNSDGSVTNVEFFDGTTSLGNDISSPYSVTVNLAIGTHLLTATARDAHGA